VKTNINVKGRLENSVHFCQKIGTSDFILDMIYEGYAIPLLHEPKSVFLNNNKSKDNTVKKKIYIFQYY
jgi:hypothetical protein